MKKHQKLPYNYEKKQRGGKSTTQIRRQEWVKAGAGLEMHDSDDERASPMEAAACSETSWLGLYLLARL